MVTENTQTNYYIITLETPDFYFNYINLNSVTYSCVQIVLSTKITLRSFLYSKFFIKHFGELTSPASPRLD